jgi:hypothetical protein
MASFCFPAFAFQFMERHGVIYWAMSGFCFIHGIANGVGVICAGMRSSSLE